VDTVEETSQVVQIITTVQLAAAAERLVKAETEAVKAIQPMQVQEVVDTFQISKVATTPMVLAEQVELILIDSLTVGTLMEFLQEDTAGLAQMKTEAAEEIQELSL
jgi:hypothetical protein